MDLRNNHLILRCDEQEYILTPVIGLLFHVFFYYISTVRGKMYQQYALGVSVAEFFSYVARVIYKIASVRKEVVNKTA